ncbi:MAG: fasciclin domain-containing protein, partial [Anaerolineales bacterium]|nr:fasciclin domain-containing protein [Anaerolineales bacterium]
MKRVITIFALAAALLFSLGFAGTRQAAAAEYVPNIMDIAASDSRFDTLEAAIKAAGLADTLASADNTFTVFAPTDDAFAALPAGTVESLLADPQGALTNVLLYHVVAGAKDSSAVLASSSLTTVYGTNLTVSVRDGKAYVNDSQIIITDIQAKNGIIHVIDAVLVPTSTPAKVDDKMDA